MFNVLLNLSMTLCAVSLVFGLCAFYTPWAWKSKYSVAIMYGPLGVSIAIFILVFLIGVIWS